MFRDRIIHHLYFNYTHQLFERTFIADSYSCIQGRGTHYGIARLRQHIRLSRGICKRRCRRSFGCVGSRRSLGRAIDINNSTLQYSASGQN